MARPMFIFLELNMRRIDSLFTLALTIAAAATFGLSLIQPVMAMPQDGLPVVPMPTVPSQGGANQITPLRANQQEQAREALLRLFRAQSQQNNVDPGQEKLIQEYLRSLQRQSGGASEGRQKQAEENAKKMLEMMQQMKRSQKNGQMPGNLSLPEPRTQPQASTKLIQIRLHLAKLKGVDASTLDSLRQGLADSDFASFRGAVAELQKQLAFEFQNEVSLTTIAGKKSEMTLGSEVPVKSGVSVMRGGQKVYNYDRMETGLQLTIVPKIVEDAIRLELDLAKSYLNETTPEADDSFITTQVETFKCETTTAVGNGRITMISLSEGEEVWLLTVAAMAVN